MKLIDGGGGGYPYMGAHEKKLMQAFVADTASIETAAKDWKTAADGLSDTAEDVDKQALVLESDAFGPNQPIGQAAAARYRTVAKNLRERSTQMMKVSKALSRTQVAIENAQNNYWKLPAKAQDPATMPGHDTPVVGPVITQVQHQAAVAKREAQAKTFVDLLEKDLRDSRDDIRGIAGDAPPPRNGPGDTSPYNPNLPGANPPGPGNNGPGNNGPGNNDPEGPDFNIDPPVDPEDPTDPTDPPVDPEIPEVPPVDPEVPEVPPIDPTDPPDGGFQGPPGTPPPPADPSAHPVGPRPGPSGSGITGGVAGTVGAGVVSGAGAIAASRPSVGGVRGIVPGSNTTLGRSGGAAPRGGAIGRGGMVPGTGGRAGGTGGSGTGGRTAAGSRGMVPGAGGRGTGAGAGGRGAPGRGGRGVAGGRGMVAGAGGVRGKKDRDQQDVDHFEYDDPDSWLDDDGTTDAVID